jgi:hypothetical protein
MSPDISKSGWQQADKYHQQEMIQADAKLLTLDLNFFNPGTRFPKALVHQSQFADLLVISPLNAASIQKLPISFPEKFFEQNGCSVLLCPNVEREFEEIVVLFDYDLPSITALKSFLNVFGNMAARKQITLLTVTPDEGAEFILEKYFVNFLQRTFPNVGIAPINRTGLLNQVFAYVQKAKSLPLVIMGKHAQAILNDASLKRKMIEMEMSLFFSN